MSQPSRFRFPHAVLVPALLLALAGWAGHPAAARAEGGTLKFAPHAAPRVLDPMSTTAYIVRNHGYMIYDTLFAMDKDFKPQPQMVDRWSVSGDKLTWNFTLRKGLLWHDGAPVTARDCAASLKRWGARDTMGIKMMTFVKAIEAKDSGTLVIRLKEPFALMLDALAKPSSNVPFMMPERVASTDPQKLIEDYTGSGPFKFTKAEFVPGSKAVYEKFAGYVPRPEPASSLAGGKRVYVDRVEWLYFPDHNTKIAALKNGEIDFYEDPPIDLLALVKDDPAISIVVGDKLGFQGALRFNHLLPPFNNVKARQAVFYMINQDDVMRLVAGDPRYFSSCAAVFVCGTPGASTAGAEDVKVNLDKARQLLKEGGYAGEKVVLMDPTDLNVLHSMAQGVVPMLRRAGMNVEVQALDWSTVVTRRQEKKPIAEGGWNIFITAATGVDLITPLAHFHINPLCDKGQPGWYCDAKMADLQDRWTRASDAGRVRELYVEMQREAYASGAYVPLGQYQQPAAFRNLTGVLQAPVPVLWNIKKG